MKAWIPLLQFAFALVFAFGAAGLQAAGLEPLKVLFVGDSGSARAREFESFLRPKFTRFAVAARSDFKPANAAEFDVVVLDWPQGGGAGNAWDQSPPLGERAAWTKPTVLLGSAGLNLAVAWKLRGGAG